MSQLDLGVVMLEAQINILKRILKDKIDIPSSIEALEKAKKELEEKNKINEDRMKELFNKQRTPEEQRELNSLVG